MIRKTFFICNNQHKTEIYGCFVKLLINPTVSYKFYYCFNDFLEHYYLIRVLQCCFIRKVCLEFRIKLYFTLLPLLQKSNFRSTSTDPCWSTFWRCRGWYSRFKNAEILFVRWQREYSFTDGIYKFGHENPYFPIDKRTITWSI